MEETRQYSCSKYSNQFLRKKHGSIEEEGIFKVR